MALSANALFHFVDKIEYLEDILNGVFYPRYCLEKFEFDMVNCTEALIPMKCFCDIPLSGIKNHINIYGRYGIGFTKEWAIRKGISPVLYVYESSPSLTMIRVLSYMSMDFIHDKLSGKCENAQDQMEYYRVLRKAWCMSAFMKPYEGLMKRGDENINVRFYDEKEWRYIPSMVSPDEFGELEIEYSIENRKNIEVLNKKSKDICRLSFEARDIKYIFVNSDSDVMSIYDVISKSNVFSDEDKKKLFTKILTVSQIEEDF